MKALVESFTEQLKAAKNIASKAVISKSGSIQNIIVTGLGGSGIGGTILNELVSDSCSVPIMINKDYFLPAFANANTLLIVSSYSGNTEETVQVMNEAISRKVQIVCVTSGGKVLELAKQHQFDFIEIPGGNPPRSCIGYSLVQLIQVLIAKGFADKKLITDLDKSIELLTKEKDAIKAEATQIAKKLNGQLAVIYSLGTCEGVSVRFRQQINENSKALCWHHVFPEMNHNELVGWTTENKNLTVVTFHTSFDYKRTQKRYEVCKPIFQKFAKEVIDIKAKGDSKLEQFIYLIHIGDWISCYIADIRGIDAVEVNVINHLKQELSKF
ncbi:MAG: bifunctional phosphoglucose/phosphomannose isomerase [Bacteroidia bacterium]|jgi:glucose/mannose-6-phosphate isomerase|nr:bifunctional phosphoglucose/phosphomannose isomerase [Sphingobacteriaceae bacterium]MBP9069354.1 bifunctional phosphoglucose/phosphomannose isomerase [Bacteroidia bacterium]